MRYLVYNEYFATGEGITIWLSIEYGDPDEAKSSHIHRFGVPEYYHVGIDVYELEGTRAQNILKSYYKKGVRKMIMDGATEDVALHAHWNLS